MANGEGPDIQLCSPNMTLENAFAVLADAHCRTVLTVLSERESAIGIESLSKAVAKCEETGGQSGVRTKLVHSLLPQLHDDGLLIYDRRRKRVIPNREISVPECVHERTRVTVCIEDRAAG